jgi:cytochrome c oxidase cbb3-type subunit 2
MIPHDRIERNLVLLAVLILVTISVGGLVEIVPLFAVETTIERVRGVRPYSPLELLGRDIYIREGCYTCHSQMVRPFRDEVERYGPYSLAAESMYDHPFQWGSKRTGPDLARVGGRYSNAWHAAHLADPRSLVPESIMPAYPYLVLRDLDYFTVGDHLAANRAVGVPYDEIMEASAVADVEAQVRAEGNDDMLARYPGAATGDLDGDPHRITEADALIAYLQILGRMVDFTSVTPEDLRQ